MTKGAGVGRSEHTRRGARRQLSRAAWVAARSAKKKRSRRAEEKKVKKIKKDLTKKRGEIERPSLTATGNGRDGGAGSLTHRDRQR